ncbi:hypothetical protein AX16_001085 [Volvariella volvacea WC 439]|nr:hypothetical protein AX16_001085 [Volvariella volvacea WC 439]
MFGINLPLGIIGHAAFLTSYGLYLCFFTKPNSTPLGITTLAIGLSYLTTAYMPMEQNALLYASVPVRLFLALIAAARALSVKDTRTSQEKAKGVENPEDAKSGLWFIVALDGVGGLLLGLWLGTFSGRMPGY